MFWKFLIPGWNRYMVMGVILGIIGFLLIPFLIGIPIMMVGWLMATFGFFWGIICLVPGAKERVLKFKKYLIDYYKTIIRGNPFKEVMKK
jgi:hypothetical protein